MKKFWMIGLLALASANSFQTTRAADNTIYQPIFKKLNVARLPVDHINKAVDVLEKQIRGGQSKQPQISDLNKTKELIDSLIEIKKWSDEPGSKAPEKKTVDYLSDLGAVSSLLKETSQPAELDPIAQHIIQIKQKMREPSVDNLLTESEAITAKNIELIPLKFFKKDHIFAKSIILKNATVFELKKALDKVDRISEDTRININNLIKQIQCEKNIKSSILIDDKDVKKIEEAVNRVINSQSAGEAPKEQPAETNQKKEPEQKTPSRRQRRLANQNKGDKKGKKKSFWKKLRFWKWFRKKKKNKTNQTAAAPKRRSQSLKPTVTVTDVPAKNTSDAKKTEVTTDRRPYIL
jgi:chemotaxis protein histidine kinase CheA